MFAIRGGAGAASRDCSGLVVPRLRVGLTPWSLLVTAWERLRIGASRESWAWARLRTCVGTLQILAGEWDGCVL